MFRALDIADVADSKTAQFMDNTALAVFPAGQPARGDPANQPVLSEPDHLMQGGLLIGTLDGTLYSIDPDTGNTLWEYQGDPILQTDTDTSHRRLPFLPDPRDGALCVGVRRAWR